MTNKELAAAFIEAMRVSDVDKLSSMISDNFSWWIAGKPEYLATAGEHDKDFFIGFFGGGADTFPNGVKFVVTGMVAEGDKVAAEATITATTATGVLYDNSYHFLFTMEDGKITRMKEYMDTHHAKTTFGM
ncbi:MAG: nuclear transport factor 2 family protein [Devosiaceae bacterium]|nr:nuclear transport factor 2 family protein [Devosiaceae bacterium]